MSSAPDTAAKRRPPWPTYRQWAVFVLIFGLLHGQLAWIEHEEHLRIENEAKSRLENHSQVLFNNLQRQLQSIDTALVYMRSSVAHQRDSAAGMKHLGEELKTLAKMIDGVGSLCIFDAQGTMVACSQPAFVGKNFAGRDYFQALQQQPQPDRLHVSAPYTTLLGTYTIALSRPLLGPDGRFAGIVAASLDTNGLRAMLAAQQPPAGTRLWVAHGDGTLLLLYPERADAPAGTRMDRPGSHFDQHLRSGRPASLLSGQSAVFGKEVFLSLRNLQPPALQMDAPLVLAAGRDVDDILAAWRADVRQHLLRAMIGTLLAAAILWYFQQRQRNLGHALEQEEAQHRHSQRLLARFLENLPALAYVKDTDSRFLMANRAFLDQLGLPPAEICGKTSQALFPGAQGEKFAAEDRTVLASGETLTTTDYYSGRDYETVKFLIADGAGPPEIGGISFDVTARKQAERALAAQMAELRDLNRQLKEAQSQLLQAEKMASVGQLAAGVAHEINNPVGFVSSNLGTLHDYLRDIFRIARICEEAAAQAANPADFQRIQAAKREVDFDFIKDDIFKLVTESADGLRRVRRIVKDLKDFSHPGEARWQQADLHAGLDSTLNIVWHELKYKCEVVKEYGELPPVWCEPSQINQVFMNLLTNAGHAIAAKGTITIRTGREGDAVWIAIGDTGSGIAPENLQKIFDPFFTTKPVGEGTGLGLSLIYGIVQQHRGHIEVSSVPGQGTTFTVRLPIGAAAAAAPAPSIGESTDERQPAA